MASRKVFEAIVYVLRTGCQWKALPKKCLVVRVPSINTFWSGSGRGSLYVSGAKDLQSMTRWKGLLGVGRVSMGRW
jgi:hypothetical protein